MITSSAVHLFSSNSRHEYDLFINATGFEERASSLVRSDCILARQFVSFLFDEHRVLGFEENKQIMQRMSATLIPDPIDFCRQKFRHLASRLNVEMGRRIKVGIDVSSMNRTMAATALMTMVAYRHLIGSLDVFYVPALYGTPKLTFSPIEQIGAVTPELSGFDSEPGLPIALILGLGFEYGTAVGLIHRLEPQFTLCLRATGHDGRFEEAVRHANLEFDFSTYNVEISEYEILNIESAYRHIENIVLSLVPNLRVVLVPMGPKILASILVLIALRYFGKIAVWRVARPLEPMSVLPDAMYLIGSIDLSSEPQALSLDRLRQMIEAEDLEFLMIDNAKKALA